jgi:hypothetical protein
VPDPDPKEDRLPNGDWRPKTRGPLCGTRYNDTCGCQACERYCDEIDSPSIPNDP